MCVPFKERQPPKCHRSATLPRLLNIAVSFLGSLWSVAGDRPTGVSDGHVGMSAGPWCSAGTPEQQAGQVRFPRTFLLLVALCLFQVTSSSEDCYWGYADTAQRCSAQSGDQVSTIDAPSNHSLAWPAAQPRQGPWQRAAAPMSNSPCRELAEVAQGGGCLACKGPAGCCSSREGVSPACAKAARRKGLCDQETLSAALRARAANVWLILQISTCATFCPGLEERLILGNISKSWEFTKIGDFQLLQKTANGLTFLQ